MKFLFAAFAIISVSFAFGRSIDENPIDSNVLKIKVFKNSTFKKVINRASTDIG